MEKKIAVVLPVRDGGTGRFKRLQNCLNSYLKFTENLSDVHVILDQDDLDNYNYLDNYSFIIKHVVPEGLTLMQKINTISLTLAEKYPYLAFIGDDIVFKTSWESKFIGELSKTKNGLVYGNDLHQGKNLATHPCITSNMVKAVGFFGCPAVEHNFFDVYWLEIVRLTGTVKYLPEVVMEHMHPNAGKNPYDYISIKINNNLISDQQRYKDYMSENKISDIFKIKEYNNALL
jgi:hypothetical protein